MYRPLNIDESFLIPEAEAVKPAPAVPEGATTEADADVLWTLKKWDLIECQGIFSVEENFRRTPQPQSDLAGAKSLPNEEETAVAMGRITINGKKAVMLFPDGLSVEGEVIQLKKPLVLLRRTQTDTEGDAPSLDLTEGVGAGTSRKRGRGGESEDPNVADGEGGSSSGFLIADDTPFDVLRSSGGEQGHEVSATGETFFGPEYKVVGVVERKYYFKSKPIRTSKR
jgi:hypothetical protein